MTRRKPPEQLDRRCVHPTERARRIELLEQNGWNQHAVAELLGVDRGSFGKWMKLNGIQPPPGFVIRKRRRSAPIETISVFDCRLLCKVIGQLLRGEPVVLNNTSRAHLDALAKGPLARRANGPETES